MRSCAIILPIVIRKEYFHGDMQCSEKQAPIVLEYSNHSKVVTHCQYACIISNFKGVGIHLLSYFFPHSGPSNPSSPYIHIPYCLDILVGIPVILDVFRLKKLIPSR